jgi:DNA ligase (NAD+)
MTTDPAKLNRAKQLRQQGKSIKETQAIIKAEFGTELNNKLFATFNTTAAPVRKATATVPKKKTSRSEINNLVREIKHHQALYYAGTPEISDAEFDALLRQLRALDPRNPVLTNVGAEPATQFRKASHVMHMGSQQKAANETEFIQWARQYSGPYMIEYKLDGASLELQYINGKLKKAVTRGDGNSGDDITRNAVKMQGVVRDIGLDFTGAIRGEILLFHDVWQEKYSDKANCRNAAVGISKRIDGIGSEDLNVIVYDALCTDIDNGETWPEEKETSKIKWLSEVGFDVVKIKKCNNPTEVIEYRNQVQSSIRSTLNYDIDGLVVKLNEIDLEDMENDTPEEQIAFKFELDEVESTLIDVKWSFKGSNYTPVGIINPIQIAGGTIQRANLCNPGFIRDMGLKIGSRVIVTRRGEIIPKIERVVSTPANATNIKIPNTCAVCHTRLIDEDTRLYCPNPRCPQKEIYRIKTWIEVLGIKDFADSIIDPLFEKGKIKKILDLYKLTVDDIARLPGKGMASATKAYNNLHKKERVSFPQFIAGFNIEGIGESTVNKVVTAGFGTVDQIANATVSELSSIQGVGPVAAEKLISGVKLLKTQMNALLDSGFIMIMGRNVRPSTSGHANGVIGKSFCITGALQSMTRDEAKEKVLEAGGIWNTSVSRNTSYLVTNDTSTGTAKNRKAAELGVRIINEQQFLALF